MMRREEMDHLTDDEFELLNRIAKVLGKDVEEVSYFSYLKTMKSLVEVIENAPTHKD